MTKRFHWRLFSLWISFSLALLLLQSLLTHWFQTSRILTCLLSLTILAPLIYLVSKRLSRPVSEVLQKLEKTSVESSLPPSSNSEDDLSRLSRGIDEMLSQRTNNLDSVVQERDRLLMVLQRMTEGVLMVDGRGRIQMVNDALRDLLVLPGEVYGRMPLEVVRHNEFAEALQGTLQDGKVRTLGIQLPPPTERSLEVYVVALRSREGGSEGALGVFHDVTRLKELEKMRQDFVANVSHELRTPLATIKAYAETLLEGALKEEVASHFVSVIKKHVDRLAKIVEDLLLLSKIETHRFEFKREVVTVEELLDDVFDFVKEGAEQKKIILSRGKVSPDAVVEADRDHLEQVLINLLDNAIKYTPIGGTITVSALEKAGEIEFAVQDNGIGIPKEALPRIFERFYRVDKRRSQEQGGTGLGLSIVKHIVQGHGGRVWVESEMGKGSTFFFTLPRGQTEADLSSPN